jgi:predicted nucleotide-binding protein
MAKGLNKSANAERSPRQDAAKQARSDFPKHSLEDALRVPIALAETNGGRPLPPVETAAAMDVSPGSSDFRVILSSAFKYGLTNGSFNGDRISLETIGRRIVEPTSEEEKRTALVQAALNPPTFKQIYEYYKGKKFPDSTFFQNTVVREFEVPRERAAVCHSVFKANMEFLGLLKTLPTGAWLSADIGSAMIQPSQTEEVDEEKSPVVIPAREIAVPAKQTVKPLGEDTKPKVFIAHGKNLEIVEQLKQLLSFGNFEPVVATQNETTARPLPVKVMSAMKSCSAGIIHVATEEPLLDSQGNPHHRLNENVLIEIGAAMALYGDKFILLVQKGVHLPSNLDGLYKCHYEGEKLDYDATMKLLKTFSDFRK